MARYIVCPIATSACDSLNRTVVLLETNDRNAAKDAASRCGGYPYGCGVLDRWSDQIDVGFGFGVPCPDLPPDAA